MSKLRVGIIGTGSRKKPPSALGYHMAYEHAKAYSEIEACELVACADISPENGGEFAEACNVTAYLDYNQMLAEEKLDMVSICTWMHLHEVMVLDAIKAGVKVIHCEKPMASDWGGSKRIATAAKEAGVQLTFNHQRRYGAPFFMAKELYEKGVIGKLVRQEVECGNIYEGGTHFIDMMSFFQGEVPAKWVLAAIDARTEAIVFGMHNENQQIVLTEYENGSFGLIMSGAGGARPVGCINRLIGSEGVIEVGVADGPDLRYRSFGMSDWEVIDTQGGGLHGPNFIESAMADVVDCYLNGKKCQLDASNALIATEIIFGAFESVRRRGRVDFPLDVDDNALEAMVANGDLKPAKAK